MKTYELVRIVKVDKSAIGGHNFRDALLSAIERGDIGCGVYMDGSSRPQDVFVQDTHGWYEKMIKAISKNYPVCEDDGVRTIGAMRDVWPTEKPVVESTEKERVFFLPVSECEIREFTGELRKRGAVA